MSNESIKLIKEEFKIDGSWSLGVKLLKRFPNKYFVETGTFKGGGLRAAWEAGFRELFSIEINEKLFNTLTKHFIHVPEVHLFLGDSAKVLPKVLSFIDEPATIFLDAHRRETERIKFIPLLYELKAIKKHSIKTHTILIDDISSIKKGIPDWKGITLKVLINQLRNINDEYIFEIQRGKLGTGILIARLEYDTSL